MKNYYDVLEVSRKASKDTINKIFKIHMKATHPDLFQGDEKIKAEEKSKELTEAYNVLSDDAQRAKYDAELEAEESSSSYNQVQAVMEENEYLKQVIAKKDEYINRLTSGSFENTNYNQYSNGNGFYQNPYTGQAQNSYQQQNNPNAGYSGFNGFTPPQPQNPYEGMSVEELKELKKEQTKLYYKNLFKDIGIKLLILGLLIIVLLISLMSSFKDLAALFGE
jgi:curved DNA-binding protein CbpA